MTAPDMVTVIGSLGAFVVSLGGLAVQIITALRVGKVEQVQVVTTQKVAKVEEHTNGMLEQMIASAKKEGAQEEKDKQS